MLMKTSGRDVRKPRVMAGEISAVYTGAIMREYPTPIPATALPAMRNGYDGARPMRSAPSKNVAAARTMVYRRPIRSEVAPAAKDPISEHTFKEPTRISTWVDEILRLSLIYSTAPLITPISAHSKLILPYTLYVYIHGSCSVFRFLDYVSQIIFIEETDPSVRFVGHFWAHFDDRLLIVLELFVLIGYQFRNKFWFLRMK